MILLDTTAHPVIGHRGASAEAPENTLPAFLRAIEQGVDAIELDVHVTADDIPVVMHDPTVMRTTSGVGALASMSLRKVRELDAGARFTPDGGKTFPYREQGIRVPTVEEVLGAIPADMPMLIEVKAIHAQWALRRVLERFKAAPRCVVASFEAGSLNAFLEPPFTCGASRRDVLELMARSAAGLRPGPVPYRAICPPNEYYGVPVPIGLIVKGARALNATVHVWTVDAPAEAKRLWELGVNGIISNAPARILEARRQDR
jgi:glycerophosphoryl diester phosphodiesterase